MGVTGFESTSTEVLEHLRGNLLKGMELAAAHEAAGTLYVSKDVKSCPPAAGAWLTKILLEMIDETLAARNTAG